MHGHCEQEERIDRELVDLQHHGGYHDYHDDCGDHHQAHHCDEHMSEEDPFGFDGLDMDNRPTRRRARPTEKCEAHEPYRDHAVKRGRTDPPEERVGEQWEDDPTLDEEGRCVHELARDGGAEDGAMEDELQADLNDGAEEHSSLNQDRQLDVHTLPSGTCVHGHGDAEGSMAQQQVPKRRRLSKKTDPALTAYPSSGTTGSQMEDAERIAVDRPVAVLHDAAGRDPIGRGESAEAPRGLPLTRGEARRDIRDLGHRPTITADFTRSSKGVHRKSYGAQLVPKA